MLVSKGWVQAVVLVMLFGFFVLGLLAYRTFTTPSRRSPSAVVDVRGQTLFTAEDVQQGQQVFLHNGLMEYGSVFGHGAYLGPDFTADYLRRAADLVRRSYGGARVRSARTQRTIEDFRTKPLRRGDAERSRCTRGRRRCPPRLVGYYSALLLRADVQARAAPDAITDRDELRQLTAFFAWTAWAGSTERPGQNYSYTNNWPPEPRVDNKPTANVVVWSVLSLIALLGGIGTLFGAFGRWRLLGWHGRSRPRSLPHAR